MSDMSGSPGRKSSELASRERAGRTWRLRRALRTAALASVDGFASSAQQVSSRVSRFIWQEHRRATSVHRAANSTMLSLNAPPTEISSLHGASRSRRPRGFGVGAASLHRRRSPRASHAARRRRAHPSTGAVRPAPATRLTPVPPPFTGAVRRGRRRLRRRRRHPFTGAFARAATRLGAGGTAQRRRPRLDADCVRDRSQSRRPARKGRAAVRRHRRSRRRGEPRARRRRVCCSRPTAGARGSHCEPIGRATAGEAPGPTADCVSPAASGPPAAPRRRAPARRRTPTAGRPCASSARGSRA